MFEIKMKFEKRRKCFFSYLDVDAENTFLDQIIDGRRNKNLKVSLFKINPKHIPYWTINTFVIP